MRLIKVGTASLDTIVGDFDRNLEKVVAVAKLMAQASCTIGCFQEQVFAGYPCEDLVQWSDFIPEQMRRFNKFVAHTRVFAFSTVFVVGLAVVHEGNVYNCAAVVHWGKVLGIVPKEKLPSYGIFYEGRTITAGFEGFQASIAGIPFGDMIFEFPFGVLGVEVCEDLWASDGPMRRRAYSGAELIVNISASPWRVERFSEKTTIVQERKKRISVRAADNNALLVYVNQYGGNDALVFDGGTHINMCGAPLLESPRWCESFATCVVDVDIVTRRRREDTTWRTDALRFRQKQSLTRRVEYPLGPYADANNEDIYTTHLASSEKQDASFSLGAVSRTKIPGGDPYFEDLIHAGVTALGGYIEKQPGVFDRILISLSGGKDSLASLLLAYQYACWRFSDEYYDDDRATKIHDFIHCISMPSPFNSDDTIELARAAAQELGVTFYEVPIQDAIDRECEALCAMQGGNTEISELTRQNIQARIRGMRMWNLSNNVRGLWLQTGNLSEKAVGYTTIGGDMMGGYSLIGDLPKTVITELLEYFATHYHYQCARDVLSLPASAELKPEQKDESDLMPYVVLDACCEFYAGDKMSPIELASAIAVRFKGVYPCTQLEEWVATFLTLFHRSVFKWVQAPMAAHLGRLNLDRDRALQIPVVKEPNHRVCE